MSHCSTKHWHEGGPSSSTVEMSPCSLLLPGKGKWLEEQVCNLVFPSTLGLLSKAAHSGSPAPHFVCTNPS